MLHLFYPSAMLKIQFFPPASLSVSAIASYIGQLEGKSLDKWPGSQEHRNTSQKMRGGIKKLEHL